MIIIEHFIWEMISIDHFIHQQIDMFFCKEPADKIFESHYSFYPLDFLVSYHHRIGKMAVIPRIVDILKVGQAVVFFLYEISIFQFYCNMLYQKDVCIRIINFVNHVIFTHLKVYFIVMKFLFF